MCQGKRKQELVGQMRSDGAPILYESQAISNRRLGDFLSGQPWATKTAEAGQGNPEEDARSRGNTVLPDRGDRGSYSGFS
jgi:hypothetical protein